MISKGKNKLHNPIIKDLIKNKPITKKLKEIKPLIKQKSDITAKFTIPNLWFGSEGKIRCMKKMIFHNYHDYISNIFCTYHFGKKFSLTLIINISNN